MAVPLILSIITLSFSSITFAFDLPLQDFCVADVSSPVRVNGFPCKNPSTVTADDFFFPGLHVAGNTSNPYGIAVIRATAAQIPGLNTLGVSFLRFDFAPKGVVPPYTHLRASQIVIVLQGSLHVGFIASIPSYTHFSKVLRKGDVFVFPVGLVHYMFNASPTRKAVALTALNSETPGAIPLPNAVFGAKPSLDADFLAKAFQVDRSVVDGLLKKF